MLYLQAKKQLGDRLTSFRRQQIVKTLIHSALRYLEKGDGTESHRHLWLQTVALEQSLKDHASPKTNDTKDLSRVYFVPGTVL